jgi:hypothetical protein
MGGHVGERFCSVTDVKKYASVKHEEETINVHGSMKIQCYPSRYLTQEETEITWVPRSHINTSRAETRTLDRHISLVKWKAWPVVILIKACFFQKP